MADIFLSYSQIDRAEVEPLAHALEAEGWSVWWDPEIVGGVDFRKEIEAELEAARCVVVAWSTNSVGSRWVRDEADEGLTRGLLVPVTIDGTRAPIGFRAQHAVPMNNWDGSRSGADYTQLVQGVRRILDELAPGAESEARDSATPPETREVPPEQSSTTGSTASSASVRPRPNALYVSVVGAAIVGGLLVVVLAVWQPWGSVRLGTGAVAEKPSTPTRKDFEPEMVRVPAGAFEMGAPPGEAGRFEDEGPVHTVTVPAFAIGRYEVTFDEYDAFTDATGRARVEDSGWGRGRRPVVNVSWADARAYAAWLSAETGRRYRLPTEAEWEYAARAGTATRFWWGDEVGVGNANCYDCGSEWDNRQTAPVGSFGANAFGLHDTSGNAWEWVEDCWHDSYEGAPVDGSAWGEAGGGDCVRRVLRGGSWFNFAQFVRSAFRFRFDTVFRRSLVGFRLAQDL